MSQGWRSKAEVLQDLGRVNGRRTGAEHLDQHVVAGERPPPVHRETPDAEEMSYFFGGGGGGGGGAPSGAGPDLHGISVMLQMVNAMDDTVDNESMTLYRNNMTDEFRISKLNPCAGVYVPGTTRYITHHNSPKKRSMSKGNDRIFSKNINVAHSTEAIRNRADTNALPQYSYMFKSKSEIAAEKCSVNDVIDKPDLVKKTLNSNKNAQAKPEASNTESVNSPTNSTLINGLPKRKIEKSTVTDDSCKIATNSEEIKEIQEKIKSTIIAASTENSLQLKRQKNVAIATLLKMGTTAVEPVKLIKPDYFENPPAKENIEKKSVANAVAPSRETNTNDIDQDSISKVNGWFNSMECPKPKALPQEPLTLKDDASAITFKKKMNSSVTSRNSDNIKENKKEPPLREVKAFRPSSYASDLLKQYEENARAAPPVEDLGTRLERQLRERDELIRKKMARQKAG